MHKVKDFILPTKANNFKSPLLSNKALTVYFIFLLFINIILPIFAIKSNVSILSLYNNINKYREDHNLKDYVFSKSLSQSAQFIIDDIQRYQYLSRINPITGYTYYSFIDTKRFSNNNEIILKNYNLSNINTQNIFNSYSNAILNKTNDIGIATQKINFFGTPSYITVILTAYGNSKNVEPVFTSNTRGEFIDYSIITYTDFLLIIFILSLMFLDITFSIYYNSFEDKSIPHTNFAMVVIAILIILILVIGISI
jgi:hypothetical protein